MSRTFRFIATWAVTPTPWDKTWVGVNPQEQWRLKWDDRNRHENGYDSHIARSYVYGVDGWKENYAGKARKFVKSYYHRKRRRKNRKLIQEWLEIPENQGVDSVFESA